MRLDFAERILDGVEIRGVLRQVAQGRACGRNGFADTAHFVRSKIVHNHDIAAPQRWNQKLFHPFDEGQPVHGPIHYKGRNHAVMAQASHERDRLPVTVRRVSHQPHTACAATSQAYHIGGGGGLVDKHQPRRIKITLLTNPAPPRTRHVCPFLLGSVQSFF